MSIHLNAGLNSSTVKTLQDAWLDGMLLLNSLNQHSSICLEKPTLLQMPYPAIFQLLQSTRLLTLPYPTFTLLNDKTPCGLVIYALESGDDSTLPHMPVLLSSFTLKKNVLHRMGTVGKTKVTQLIIPSSLVETTLILLHHAPSAGHPSREKTLSMARAKYY